MIFIVAANQQHAVFCAREERLHSDDWKYVRDAQVLRGVEGEVIFYETWVEHPEAREIAEVIKQLVKIGRLTVREEK